MGIRQDKWLCLLQPFLGGMVCSQMLQIEADTRAAGPAPGPHLDGRLHVIFSFCLLLGFRLIIFGLLKESTGELLSKS